VLNRYIGGERKRTQATDRVASRIRDAECDLVAHEDGAVIDAPLAQLQQLTLPQCPPAPKAFASRISFWQSRCHGY
jgi:hypothetical protein